NYVTIFIGASISMRRLSNEQGGAMIRSLLEKNYAVAILGGKDVKKIGKNLKIQFSGPRVFNFAGKISLSKTAALIQQSEFFVGPDSGIMHVACAVGTPVVGIFGPGNLNKWRPLGPKHTVVTKNVECAPCTRFGYTIPTCRGSYICTRNLVPEILAAIKNNSEKEQCKQTSSK